MAVSHTAKLYLEISASLLASKLLSDFHYLFHHNCVFISGYKSVAFCSVDRDKKHGNPSCAEEL